MKVNNTNVVERSSRPNASQKVALRSLFINDGSFQDPYQISSVSIFRAQQNLSPSSVLGTDVLVSAIPLMQFANSATLTTNSVFDASNYTPGSTASGIFKTSTGQYAVVLDGAVSLSGVYGGSVLPNGASSTDNYIDVWTVKMIQGSNYQVFINQFKLFDDTFIAITEPLLVTTNHTLSPKHIKLGSKVDLKITTDIAITNKNIDANMVSIFKDSLILDPAIRIQKLNFDNNVLPARVEVSGFSDTSSLVTVTGENTVIFSWDTSLLATHPQVALGNVGGLVGTYMVEMQYTILNEIKRMPVAYVIVN